MTATTARPIKRNSSEARQLHRAVLRLTCTLKRENKRHEFYLLDKRLPVATIVPKVHKILRSFQDGDRILTTVYPRHDLTGKGLVFVVAHTTAATEHPDTPAQFAGILSPHRPGELLIEPLSHPAFGLRIEGLPTVPRRGLFRLPDVILTPAMQLRSISEPEWVGEA